MNTIKITLKHDYGEDEIDLSEEVAKFIAYEAVKEGITFEEKFNNMLRESIEALKEADEN